MKGSVLFQKTEQEPTFSFVHTPTVYNPTI